ncbi:MAG: hypothetical protein H0X24_05495 [Ktedonobacterales bacterium]|nr:hypothetical protein [Ktedonobacterales bacterium]
MSYPPDSSNNPNPEIAPITQPFQPAPGEGMTTPPPAASAYPGYPAGYQPSTTPPVAPAPTPRRGGAAGAIIATVVIIAVLAGGGLYALGRNGSGPLANIAATATVAATATPTMPPTATPTPAPPAGFQYFTASDNSYRMLYPVGWLPVAQSLNGLSAQVFALPDPNAPIAFIAVPSPQKIPPSQYSTYLQQAASLLQATDVKLSPTTTSVTLGSTTWTKDVGTLTVQGKPYSGVVLGTDWKTGTFLAVYAAPTTSFTSAEQQFFTTMATSILFLS